MGKARRERKEKAKMEAEALTELEKVVIEKLPPDIKSAATGRILEAVLARKKAEGETIVRNSIYGALSYLGLEDAQKLIGEFIMEAVVAEEPVWQHEIGGEGGGA